MSELTTKSTIHSAFYKMDHVLNEINDQQGILEKGSFEPWKKVVLDDLLKSGFIKLDNDFYVLTEDGKEVIKQDSLLYYNKRRNFTNIEQNEVHFSENSDSLMQKVFLVSGSILLLVTVISLMTIV